MSRNWFDNILPVYNDRDVRRRMRTAWPTFYKLADIIHTHTGNPNAKGGRPKAVPIWCASSVLHALRESTGARWILVTTSGSKVLRRIA